jgi:hypothetical protein
MTCASMGLKRRAAEITDNTSMVMEDSGAMHNEVEMNAPLMLTSSSRPRAACRPD